MTDYWPIIGHARRQTAASYDCSDATSFLTRPTSRCELSGHLAFAAHSSTYRYSLFGARRINDNVIRQQKITANMDMP